MGFAKIILQFIQSPRLLTSKKKDSKLPTLVAYMDFRKAFDCVHHPILGLGIDRSVINWVDSYLSN